MTTSTRIQLATAAAILAAAPVAASADQLAFSAAPVALQTVSATENNISLPFGARELYLNDLSVGFTNGTNVAATNVRFAITRDGKTKLVDARGTFAPGTHIDRRLATETNTLPQATPNVSIAKVEFADGSVWTPASGNVASR